MRIKPSLGKIITTALLVVAANAAGATSSAIGAISKGIPASFGGFAPAGNFVDNFTFFLPATSSTGYSVINFAPIGFGGTLNTTFSSLTLVSDPDGVLASADDVVLANSNGLNANTLSFTASSLPAGNYYLQVAGFTSGSLGGLYSGAVSASVATPVPEVESYAMLLAGLGLVGGVAMRRKYKEQ